jgi:hypothetical protein
VRCRSARHWTYTKRALAFCRLTQDGDEEGCRQPARGKRLDRLSGFIRPRFGRWAARTVPKMLRGVFTRHVVLRAFLRFFFAFHCPNKRRKWDRFERFRWPVSVAEFEPEARCGGCPASPPSLSLTHQQQRVGARVPSDGARLRPFPSWRLAGRALGQCLVR